MRREYPNGQIRALKHAARFSQYEAEILDAVDEIERLRALLVEARHFIRDEVEENYPWRHKYPQHQIRYELDMDIVNRIDAALAGKEDKP